VTAPALDAWRQILLAVPGSRLIIHAAEGKHRQRVLDFFAEGEVDPQRLEFVGFAPTTEYLQQFSRIDIALDPFPYSGGTSTCDALWMGVPVLSLAGQTAVARSGLSILTNIGLPQLVTHSPQEYITLATTLASETDQLADWRSTLRERMQNSALMDEAGFAQEVESAYRQMWKNWCEAY
jgi:protein O-GlcNAc transferase